jgi:hypothetical protein
VQRNWQGQYDYCRANNGGMDLVSLESNEEERAIHAAWTTSKRTPEKTTVLYKITT